MWARHGADKKEKNTIVHSFNRNFAARQDGNPNTLTHLWLHPKSQQPWLLRAI
jgi:hypothetical protein